VIPNVIPKPLPWHKPRRQAIQGIVVHAMGERIVAGETVTALELLRRSPELCGATLSAHRLILPDGTVFQCVADTERAWHAGHSKLGVLENLNETFLGVELLLPGEYDYAAFKAAMQRGSPSFTDEQYNSVGWCCAEWATRYELPFHRIVGHQQVAGDDVRGEGKGKVDPGQGFNWGRFQNLWHMWTAELGGG